MESRAKGQVPSYYEEEEQQVMNPDGRAEERLRLEWLMLNRAEACPACCGLPPHKKEWMDYTRLCTICGRVWRTFNQGERWSFEGEESNVTYT